MIVDKKKPLSFLAHKPAEVYILSGFILMAYIIAFYQLMYGRSLWFDEANLAINIVDKSITELFSPLDREQVAPIGFLLLSKLSILLFGQNDIALRLVPFLSFSLSIPVFYWLCNQLFKHKTKSLFAVAIFVLNINLIYYSSEFKQYSTDVFIAITTVYLSVSYNKHQNSFWKLITIIVIGLWFSNACIIIGFTALCYLGLSNSIPLKEKLILALVFVLSFLIYYSFFIHQHPTKAFMQAYWKNAFLPLNQDAFPFILKNINQMLVYYLPFGRYTLLSGSIFLTGLIISILKGKKEVVFFALTAWCTHLVLSCLKLYPLSMRLSIYLCPFVIVIFTYGLFQIIKWILPKKRLAHSFSYLLIISVCYIPIITKIPLRKEELKSVLIELKQLSKPHEPLYIYYGAEPSFQYYTKLFPSLNRHPITYGADFSETPKMFLDDFPEDITFWIVFAHVHHYASGKSERKHLIALIKEQNAIIETEIYKRGASAYKVKRNL